MNVVTEPVTTSPDSEARADGPGPTQHVEAQTAADLPAVARPSAETRPSIDPSIRATVESMVAQTAKPDETPSAAATAWISRSEGDASDATSETIGRLGIDLVSTIVNCSGRRGAAAADWRPAHLYSFLSTMRGLDKQRVSTLRDVLLAGRRGDISSSRARRLATRLLVDDLRNLERFQHALRKTSAPISDSGVSWFDPKSGLELYAYASCGMAAKEWGLTPELVRDCVESKKPVNGLHFRRQYRWPLPAGAEAVARGVYRVEDRYRVQLGESWGFLGNFDSAGAAILVHNDARGRLREVGTSLMTRSARQLIKGQPVAMSGAYVILRRLEAGYSLPPKSFSMRATVLPIRSFSGNHDVYFVSRRPGLVDIANTIATRGSRRERHPAVQRWQDPVDRNRGMCTWESLRTNRSGSERYLVHHHELTQRSGDNNWTIDESADFSLVQVFRVQAPEPEPEPEPERPAEWAQCSSCERWRLLPEGASVGDKWTCGEIGVSCEKVECSLEDETCACHTADETVVVVAEDGTVEATYCSPAGAGAALGLDASVILSYAQDRNARPLRVSSLVVYGSDQATVGTRVWALFDHSGQKWWGGTVVGNEKGKLDIVFDDGDRQMLPAKDIRFSPPVVANALSVTEPGAGARAQLAELGLDAAAQTPAAPSALPTEGRLPKPHVQMSQLLRTKILNPLFARPGSRWFSRPVSSKQFPHYRDVISKPCDLSTIARRIDQYKYRSPVDLLADFDLIASNSLTFNGADHAITKDAQALAAAARAACYAHGKDFGALERATRAQTAPAALERAHDSFASADEIRRSLTSKDSKDDFTYGRVFRKLAKRLDGAVGYPKGVAVALQPLDAGALYADPSTVVSRDGGVGTEFELVGGSCFLVARSRTARLARSLTPNVFLETRYDGRLVVAWRILRNVAEGETLVAAPPQHLLTSARPLRQPNRSHQGGSSKRGPWFQFWLENDAAASEEFWKTLGETEKRPIRVLWTRKYEENLRASGQSPRLEAPPAVPFATQQRTKGGTTPDTVSESVPARDETSSKVRYRPDSADESEQKEATSRVWALFEADPGIQRWWGGTVVGASGSGATRTLDVVFDDGERLVILEQRVKTEQPMPLPINTPNAAAKKLLRKLSGRRPRKRARRSTPVATHGRSTRTRRGPAKSYAQSDTDSDSDDVAERRRPPPRSPGPLPKDSTCCICLDPVLRRRDAIIFECDHFVCKSCSSDLARHTAEAGAVSTRRGVSVTCPLCRRRAKLEISN